MGADASAAAGAEGFSEGSGRGRLHPLVRAAGEGIFPLWTRAGAKRRAHMARVAALLGEWGKARGKSGDDLLRWKAAGFLHDVLREEDADVLRPIVTRDFPELHELPEPVLHGPAASIRLREEGVVDAELLHAIAFHTLGHPDPGELGLALYAADFLEPGRRFRMRWRHGLRRRAPLELEDVTREILAARVVRLVERQSPIHPLTHAFWNSLVEEPDVRLDVGGEGG